MYQGTFYNGKITQAIPSSIYLQENHLVVQPQNPQEAAVYFDYKQIVHIQKFENKVILKLSTVSVPLILEIHDLHFIPDLQKKIPQHVYFRDPYFYIRKYGVRGVAASLVAIVAILFLSYQFLIPKMIDVAVATFPKQMEIDLGRSLKNSYIDSSKVDSVRTQYLNDFYAELRTDHSYPMNFTVVKDESMNAFALPGGEIVVYTGILDSMKNYSELIGLLGHECGHVENRHTLKMLLKNLSNYILMSLVFQDYSGMIAVILENASMIEQLAFSRHNEEESDEMGYKLITENKGEVTDMAVMFQRMIDTYEVDSTSSFKFLSTHPELHDRVKVIQAKAKKENPHFEYNDLLRVKFQEVRDGRSYANEEEVEEYDE